MKYYVAKDKEFKQICRSKKELSAVFALHPHARYAVFDKYGEARDFFQSTEVGQYKHYPVCYVDGSYNVQTKEYSFGCVILYNGKEYMYEHRYSADSDCELRNVAGEVKGAAFAIQFCLNRNFLQMDLYYDYTGIKEWYVGNWKANLPLTKKYVAFAVENNGRIKVNFCKVKSHSNDKYNDIADSLAKKALNI